MKKSDGRSVKRIIAAAAAAIAAVTAAVVLFLIPVFGEAGSITEISFDLYGDGGCVVRALPADGNTYRLFLPSDTDFSSARLYYEADTGVRLDHRAIGSGSIAAVKGAGEHSLYAGRTKYVLSVYVGSDIPAVFITTESGSLDYIHEKKSNKEKGSIRVSENGEITLEAELKSVKGRGNSFAEARKKSYNIKFEEKQSLFGMEPAKKWSLVACYLDAALFKWQLGFELAQYMGINCACEYSPAELYINGEYRGMFLVCESVETGEGRVDITDLEDLNEKANPDTDTEKCAPCGDTVSEIPGSRKWVDIPVSPEDITGGYLLEFDGKEAYAEEASAFISPNGQYVVVKEPEYCSEAELDYIADWYMLAEEALAADDGFNAAGKHYSEYYDVDSLARMFVLQEYIQNTDATFSSCFFYKDKGDGKLYAGPAWDFDMTLYPEVKIADGSVLYCDRWYSGVMVAGGGYASSVYRLAFMHDDFRDAVNETWKALTENGLYGKTAELTSDICSRTYASVVMDRVRWENETPEPTLQEAERILQIDSVREFFEKRYAALNVGFSPDCSVVFYEANGGSGFVFSNIITRIGETQKVRLPKNGRASFYPPDDTYVFKCWNTARDGSGRTYAPGDDVLLTDRTTVLYAQWEKVDG